MHYLSLGDILMLNLFPWKQYLDCHYGCGDHFRPTVDTFRWKRSDETFEEIKIEHREEKYNQIKPFAQSDFDEKQMRNSVRVYEWKGRGDERRCKHHGRKAEK